MQSRYFMTANELTVFVNAQTPAITINSICYDAASGKFVLFFTPGH